MLINPSIDSLLKKVDNKYALVILTAARARQLRELLLAVDTDEENEERSKFLKEVSVSLEEINEGKIDFSFLDNYIEEAKSIIAKNNEEEKEIEEE